MNTRKPLVAVMTIAVLALGTPARSVTRYVANNGTDSTICGIPLINGFTCGAQETPCRSISCAVLEAAFGDTVMVGPGSYSNVAGEFPSGGCDCMVAVTRPVIVISSHGAASTVIDGTNSSAETNVLFITGGGGEFGRPGHGFTVTRTLDLSSKGIEIDSIDAKVRGNQVVLGAGLVGGATGIDARNPSGPLLIEGNQVVGWVTGIHALGNGKTVRKNVVVDNSDGIVARDSTAVVGNVVTGNHEGIILSHSATAIGNAVHGNLEGLVADSLSSAGRFERNNVLGNTDCGLTNPFTQQVDVNAVNNYWGAATGPGVDPADDSCDEGSTTTLKTPFATNPFRVSAPIRP